MSRLFIEVPTDEGYARIPAVYAVCPGCDGNGKQDNLGAITDMHEWDEESREAYFAGGYDVRCEECHGKRVVLVADEDAASEAQLAAYRADLEADAANRAIDASEARHFGYER